MLDIPRYLMPQTAYQTVRPLRLVSRCSPVHFTLKVVQAIKGKGKAVTLDGSGGLVVSMLASGSRVRRFEPDQSQSMPSFGGEVK
jgi:hypothetical protein